VPAKVAEQHGRELSPTLSMTLSPVLGDGLFKLLPGKQLQHLAEIAGYSYQGGESRPDIRIYVSQGKP
jgi:hypothetical protein